MLLICSLSVLLLFHTCALKTISPQLFALINHSFPLIWLLSNKRDTSYFISVSDQSVHWVPQPKAASKTTCWSCTKPVRSWREEGAGASFLMLGQGRRADGCWVGESLQLLGLCQANGVLMWISEEGRKGKWRCGQQVWVQWSWSGCRLDTQGLAEDGLSWVPLRKK